MQKNDEQFEMLCVAITDTSSGLCLFQCSNASEQVAIAEMVEKKIEKKCVILDMSCLQPEEMPDEIGKLRMLLSEQKAYEVVFLCNLQMCGALLGDEKFIERLNYMRDQMAVMNKVWVLGVSPYFASLLSRQARDLYSCIMNHFDFTQGSEDEQPFEVTIEPLGDIRLWIRQFTEYKNRIIDIKEASLDKLFLVLILWNKIRGYLGVNDDQWMRNIVQAIEKRIWAEGMEAKNIRNCLQLPVAYSYWGEQEKALRWVSMIEDIADNVLNAESDVMADVYKEFGRIYKCSNQYERAEQYLVSALKIYKKLRGENSKECLSIRILIADVYFRQRKLEKSLVEYQQIYEDFTKVYGKQDVKMINIMNGIGNDYMRMNQYSNALKWYKEAFEKQQNLIPGNCEVKAGLLNNVALANMRIGNLELAKQQLQAARDIINDIPNENLLRLYTNLYDVYNMLNLREQAIDTGKKALNLASKTGHYEDVKYLKIREELQN